MGPCSPIITKNKYPGINRINRTVQGKAKSNGFSEIKLLRKKKHSYNLLSTVELKMIFFQNSGPWICTRCSLPKKFHCKIKYRKHLFKSHILLRAKGKKKKTKSKGFKKSKPNKCKSNSKQYISEQEENAPFQIFSNTGITSTTTIAPSFGFSMDFQDTYQIHNNFKVELNSLQIDDNCNTLQELPPYIWDELFETYVTCDGKAGCLCGPCLSKCGQSIHSRNKSSITQLIRELEFGKEFKDFMEMLESKDNTTDLETMLDLNLKLNE